MLVIFQIHCVAVDHQMKLSIILGSVLWSDQAADR